MKKYINIVLTCLVAVFMTSCLQSNLEELEVYSGCDVTNGDVYWRYYGDNTIPASGEREVKQVRLTAARNQDTENCVYTIRYATNNIPQAKRADFSVSQAVVILTISTASTITPIGDAPTLGVPGDWSKEHKYEVTAADGSKKIWTVVVELKQ